MMKHELLVRPSRQLDEIERVLLQDLAYLPRLIYIEPALLPFHAVEFYAEYESRRRDFTNRLSDLDDDAGTISERATVGVCTFVGRPGEKLGEEVPVRAVQLDTVKTGSFEIFGGVGEALDDVRDLFVCRGARFSECRAQGRAYSDSQFGIMSVIHQMSLPARTYVYIPFR